MCSDAAQAHPSEPVLLLTLTTAPANQHLHCKVDKTTELCEDRGMNDEELLYPNIPGQDGGRYAATGLMRGITPTSGDGYNFPGGELYVKNLGRDVNRVTQPRDVYTSAKIEYFPFAGAVCP